MLPSYHEVNHFSYKEVGGQLDAHIGQLHLQDARVEGRILAKIFGTRGRARVTRHLLKRADQLVGRYCGQFHLDLVVIRTGNDVTAKERQKLNNECLVRGGTSLSDRFDGQRNHGLRGLFVHQHLGVYFHEHAADIVQWMHGIVEVQIGGTYSGSACKESQSM